MVANANLVNVCPYYYPHFQNLEIEHQVDEMLRSGLIRPSQNPFSTPILLVKNKADILRCYIDYRALNTLTMKDHFPISTIEEIMLVCSSTLTWHMGFIKFI